MMRNKLRSERGASMTYALLLFLVCATVGAIVLAAGTAAAGRVSDLAEMDRRYYTVTSAAELLEKEISAGTVTVLREKTDDEVTVNIDGTVFTGDTSGLTFLQRQAALLVLGPDLMTNQDAAIMDRKAVGSSDTYIGMPLTLEPEGVDMPVEGTALLSTDGTLTLRLWNKVDAADKYTLVLTFTADRSYLSLGSPDQTGSGTRRTDKVKWTLQSMEKGEDGWEEAP